MFLIILVCNLHANYDAFIMSVQKGIDPRKPRNVSASPGMAAGDMNKHKKYIY